MFSTEIIDVTNPKWETIVSKSYKYDFYHTRSYHEMEKNSVSKLFVVYDDANDFIAFPIIIRPISDTNWFDTTSVYGYCGPISNVKFAVIRTDFFTYFVKQLDLFFIDNKIISAFSRLHPTIQSDLLLKNFGDVEIINQTVSINLKQSEDDQVKQYRKSLKYDIKKLVSKGYTIEIATTKEEIIEFVAIYNQTMGRLQAKSDYYFEDDYFIDFLNRPCFKGLLLLAKFENEIVAGALFSITKNIMQYHLAGTKENNSKDAPMKLILDTARKIGNEFELDILHLGGGVGGSDDDSLFLFKCGFSNIRNEYKVWKKIINTEQYYKACETKGIMNFNNSYFPLYRFEGEIKKNNIEKQSQKDTIINPIQPHKSSTYIYGASGHARVVYDIFDKNDFKINAIIDDKHSQNKLYNIPIVDFADLTLHQNDAVFVAIGDNLIRKNITQKLNVKFINAIHPNAVLSKFCNIGKGNTIMAGAIVNSGAVVRNHCIINTGAIIEHDCKIGNYAHISPNASLAGNVVVGEGTWVGIGAVVKQNITIGKWAIIGAGAVVITDVPDYAIVVGNPSKIIKYNIIENQSLNNF